MLISLRNLNIQFLTLSILVSNSISALSNESENLSQEELEKSRIFQLFDGVKSEDIFVTQRPNSLNARFNDIIRYISRNTRGRNGFPSQVRIPFGRSPEAKFTDLNSPRHLASLNNGGFNQTLIGGGGGFFGGTIGGGFGLSSPNPGDRKDVAIPISNTIGAPDIFAAYTPNLDQLELIAWNPNKLRYDFFLVKNLSNTSKRTIEAPKRQDCISCHQNEGPHFTRLPWNEAGTINTKLSTMMEVSADLEELLKKLEIKSSASIIQELLSSKSKDEMHNRIKTLKYGDRTLSQNEERDFNIAIDNVDSIRDFDPAFSVNFGSASDGGAFGIDGDVRTANRRIQAANICKKLCSAEDVLCKKTLLSAALIPTQGAFVNQNNFNAFNPFNGFTAGNVNSSNIDNRKASTKGIETTINELKRFWPKDNFSIASSVLPDRNPIAGGEVDYLFAGDIARFNQTVEEGSVPFLRSSNSNTAADIEATKGLLHYLEIGTTSTPTQIFGPSVDLIPGSSKDPQASPLFPRPKVSQISPEDLILNESLKNFLLGDCFGIDPSTVDSVRKLSPASIEELVLRSSDSGISAAIAENYPRPKRLNEILNAHLKNLQNDKRLKMMAATNELNVKEQVFVDEIPLDEAHRLIQEKCANCHGPEGRRQRLPLENLDALTTYKGIDGDVKDYLQNGSMPPKNAPGLDPRERAALIKFMNKK